MGLTREKPMEEAGAGDKGLKRHSNSWDELIMLQRVDAEERSPWTRSCGSAVYASYRNQGM